MKREGEGGTRGRRLKARDGRGKTRWITQEESNAWVHLRVASPRKRILARGESCRPRLPGGGPPGREASGGEAWRGQRMPFSSHMKPRAVYCLQALITTVVFPHAGGVSIRDIPGPCDRSGEVNRAPAACGIIATSGPFQSLWYRDPHTFHRTNSCRQWL